MSSTPTPPLSHIDILILIGRPASGKSEILDFLTRLDPQKRLQQFKIARPDVLDDFPMLWAWFEEDAILSKKFAKPRLHTDEQGYFRFPYLWHLLIERLDLDYHKRRRDFPGYHTHTTAIFEFSRGTEHGGYAEALRHFSPEVLSRALILYVNVSFQESLRKNRRRFNPGRPDSILEHGLPDEKLERLYAEDDWPALTADDPQFLTVNRQRLPYVVFENEDDVTTGKPEQLAGRLEAALNRLFALQSARDR
jgi:hypothetical protein